MRISFIGMSNIGKSHWAQRLAATRHLTLFPCDSLIERKLVNDGFLAQEQGLQALAHWMGLPYEASYRENSQLYMNCEQAVMAQVIGDLRRDPERPAVIDTTGSVIYIGEDMLAQLRETTRVVYLQASDAHIDQLFKNFIAHPKPVIWGDRFSQQKGETPAQSLRRCYPDLLHARARRYEQLAHVTIPFAQHRDRHADIGALLDMALA